MYRLGFESWQGCTQPTVYSVGTGVLSPEVKQLGHEAAAKVMNELSYSCASPVYIHGVHMDNFIFLTVLSVSKEYMALIRLMKYGCEALLQ
jgi:hypothetical protein